MRARNLKPSIFKNEHLAKLGPWHFILFEGLWCLADRKGRLEDRPEKIEAEVFPFKFQNVNIEKLLSELSTGKEPFIIRYEVNNKRYIQIVNFEKHQRPHFNETESAIQAQPRNKVGTTKVVSTCHQIVLTPDSPSLTPDSLITAPTAKNAVKPIHVQFCDRFKESYEKMTGQPYKHKREHFVIAQKLITAHGFDVVVSKVKLLGVMCRDRTEWFTKGGWADFSIEKLSSQWNSIINGASETTDAKTAREQMEVEKKVRDHNERINSLMGHKR